MYREGLDGSEKRAREAARSDGLLLSYGSRPVDWYRINELKHSVLEEQLEQGEGDRRRAGLREDEAGNGEGKPREGKPREG